MTLFGAWLSTAEMEGEILPVTTVGCRLYNSANQNIGTSATDLSWDSEEFDTSSFHSTVTNKTRITIPETGYYIVVACVQWTGSATGTYRQQWMVLNAGATTPAGFISNFTVIGDTTTFRCTSVWGPGYFSASDYLVMRVGQDSGGTRVVEATNTAVAVLKCGV